MLDATFHLFVHSLQTPLYETDENKNNGNLRLQNVTGNETLAAPMNEENPTSLYPHVLMYTFWTIQFRLVQTYLNHKEMILMCFILQEMFPWIQLAVLTEMLPVLQVLFWITVLMEMLLILQMTEMLRTVKEMFDYPHLKFFRLLQETNSKNEKKRKKTGNKK